MRKLDIPRFYRNARLMTAREVALARKEGIPATRRWIIFRDEADRVVLGRPTAFHQHEIHKTKNL